MALYREDATGFIVDLSAPAAGYTAISAMPSDLAGRVTWWRGIDTYGQSSEWHPSLQASGEDPFPVTDPRAGSGQNTVPPDYSTFPSENTTWLPVTVSGVTKSFLSDSSGTFAGYWLRLASSAASGTAWLGGSSSDYNSAMTAGKQWILSFYGSPGGAGDVGKVVNILLKSSSGVTKQFSITILSGTNRYSGVVDFTGDSGEKAIIGFQFPASGVTLKTDRLMMEEKVGPFNTPSAFSSGQSFFNGGKVTQNTLPGSSIEDAGVTGSKVASSTITGSNIASSTITSSNIQDATIQGTDIASGTITSTNIQNATITGTDIASGTITSDNIQNASITGTDIASGTITSSNIQDATIQGTDIASGTITSSNIANATIQGTDIASATITGDRIGSLTITGGNIAAATIDSAKIISLSADKITSGTIDTDTLTLATSSGIIQSSGFVSGSTGFRIRGDGVAEFQNVTVRGTLNAGDLSSGYIPSGRYQDNTVGAGPIVSGAVHRGAAQSSASVAVTYLTNTTIVSGSSSFGPLSLPANTNRTGVLLIGMVQSLGNATQQGLLLCGWSAGSIFTNSVGGQGTGSVNVGGTVYQCNNVPQAMSIYYDTPGTGAVSYYFRAHQHILASGANLNCRVSFAALEISK